MNHERALLRPFNCRACSVALLALALGQFYPSWGRAAESEDGAGSISVTSHPSQPWVERGDGEQRMNFDLLVHNGSRKDLILARMVARIYDRTGRLVVQREVNGNGSPPAIAIVGGTRVAAGADVDIFEPFEVFSPDVDLHRVDLELLFVPRGVAVPAVLIASGYVAHISVSPRLAHPEPYCLPLRGRLLVHDGHDLLSHHRRRDLVTHGGTDPSHAVNANLYAFDFVEIGGDGSLFEGNAADARSWRTYGKPVFAPMDAVVTEMVDGVPDNSFINGVPVTPARAQAIDPGGLGNHVALRGRDGRVVWLLHFRPGSLSVRIGQQVTAGTQLGEVGFSGDALFPHLHYAVTADARYPSEPVPSMFWVERNSGSTPGAHLLETGEILEPPVPGTLPRCTRSPISPPARTAETATP